MSTTTGRPDVSLVLEHANADHTSAERVSGVLQELGRQVREAPFTVEVLVPEGSTIDLGALAGLTVRSYPVAPDAHYYDMKTAGAREAAGGVIVLADCDVTPLADWLVNLVRPLRDPAVDAVVGHTVIRPVSTVTDKAYAATSSFPAHEADKRPGILANNLAVRPSVFLPEGFPDVGCRYRGSERELDRLWAARGIRVEIALDARSLHPPPAHPIRRALWDGHDQQIDQRLTGAPFAVYLARVVLHQLLVGTMRIARHHRVVGLRPMEVPLALAINVSEVIARGVAFTITRFAHGLMHRRVQG